MRIWMQVGEVKMSNNYDANDILKILHNNGFEVLRLPSNDGFKYGLLIEEPTSNNNSILSKK